MSGMSLLPSIDSARSMLMLARLSGVHSTFASGIGGEVEATRLPSGKAWRCDTGEHRYHRDENLAAACAFAALPMTVSSDG